MKGNKNSISKEEGITKMMKNKTEENKDFRRKAILQHRITQSKRKNTQKMGMLKSKNSQAK